MTGNKGVILKNENQAKIISKVVQKLFLSSAMIFCMCISALSIETLANGISSEREDTLRATDEKVKLLVSEITRLKSNIKPNSAFQNILQNEMASESKPGCEPDNDKDKYRCAKNCTLRFSDGSCGSYGADYCGPEARCAKNCTLRYSDGSCGNYAADYCGRSASCAVNCTLRYSDGSCGSYGADICY
jgi:hypothetical protein